MTIQNMLGKQYENKRRNYLGYETAYPIDAKMGRPIFMNAMP
jgi:hypothetical protein